MVFDYNLSCINNSVTFKGAAWGTVHDRLDCLNARQSCHLYFARGEWCLMPRRPFNAHEAPKGRAL
jgi:hypothetical protein